jgi:hypothetical protein
MSTRRTLGIVAVLATAISLCAAGFNAGAAVKVPPVKACANASGVLVLPSSTGACPRGGAAVSLGARGATGATGRTGATGPKGPSGLTGPPGDGAFAVLFHANGTTTSATKALSGYTYYEKCAVSGSGASTKVTTEFVVVGKSGVKYTVVGPVLGQASDAGTITTVTDNFKAINGTSVYYAKVTGSLYRFYYDLTIFGADGSVAQFKIRLTADGKASLASGENRCMIEGTVLPT